MAKNGGQIRIISGQWRGRRLPVQDVTGLRPTTDRQKETLFNWLQGEVDGAKVLDLYAGAGGLGFEALSRYAESLVAVEKDKKVVAQLKKNAETLAANAKVISNDVVKFLQDKPEQFNLVFMDPPFRKNLVQPTLELLQPWLAPNAWVFIETESELLSPNTPETWELYREKVAGQSHSYLFRANKPFI